MTNSGAIFLHRKFRDHAFWRERREFSLAEAWLDILMEVRWQSEEVEVMLGMQIVTCSRGQSLNSLETWAKRWKWSRSKVQRFMKLLETQSMIRYENVIKSIRITVCKYDEYQDLRNAHETHVKRKRNAHETQMNTEEEVKEVKELKISSASVDAAHSDNGDSAKFFLTKKKRKLTGKRLETFEQFWDAFAYKKGKAEAADAWIDIQQLTNALVERITDAARKEAQERLNVIARGHTPKMAQGWLAARRWEDEDIGFKTSGLFKTTPIN